ncbi:helix-turn-helix transcriptional regulator [Thalassoglobus sp.]|uniref:helix-turn-helix transcriptional regulator n=1 Tax=Thalassoglobus sp. TaxID=2795869 RepID=UPI003AA96735
MATFTAPIKLSRADAASYIGVTKPTLATWASLGKGPKFVKVGSKVFYLQRHLDEYLESRATNCSSSLINK